MILQLAIFSSAGFLAAAVLMVIYRMARNTLAWLRFKRKTNLPMMSNFNPLSGHVDQVIYKTRVWLDITIHHLRYGKTFGLLYCDKPCVMSVDLDLIKLFTLDEPHDHINRMNVHLPMHEIEYNSIVFSKDDQWRRIRRALAPALSSHKFKMPNVTAEIHDSINKLVSLFETRLAEAEAERAANEKAVVSKNAQKGCLVDIDDAVHRYSLNLVFSCFYKQYEQINFQSKNDFWTDMVDEILRLALHNPVFRLSGMFPILRPFADWLVMHFSPMGYARKTIMHFIKLQTKNNLEARHQIKAAKKKNEESMKTVDEENLILNDGAKFRRNMIDVFIDQFHDGKLSKEEYFNSSFFLFLAADKTSADVLTKLIYHLGLYDDVQEKLRKSILAEGHESEYLSWVINESMRIAPPVLIGCSRTVTRDVQTESGLVPAGTFVFTPVYTIHRLPEYWGKDADEFKPERWANAKSFHPLQFLPFGAGKRSCPGKEFALYEIKLLTTELLKRYRFDAQPQPDLFDSPYFIFTVFDLPTHLRVTRV